MTHKTLGRAAKSRAPDDAPSLQDRQHARQATDIRHLLRDTQPRYASVGNALAADILEGRWRVGELLPSEQELCAAFAVSRATVREALRRLRELGLVSAIHGIGTRVVSNAPRSTFEMVVKSSADVMGYADRTILEVQRTERIRVSTELAPRLGVPAGERMVRLSGIRRRATEDGEPLSSVELYLPLAYASVAEQAEVGVVPLYRLIERYLGLKLGEVRQEITAVGLNASQSEVLNMPLGSPGLRILRRFFGESGQLLEVTVNIHPAGDRFAYAIRLSSPNVIADEHG